MTMYVSYAQVPRTSMNFLLRTALPPGAVAQSVRRVVEQRNPDIAVENLVSMDDILGDSLTSYRVTTVTLGIFSVVALLLSSLGLYGVLAYYVSTRVHEIGVRMALGAEQSGILRYVAAQSAKMVVPGIVLGFVAALAGGRLVQSMLYNVEPTDAVTFAGVTAALGLVAIVATAWPAWRAAHTDPARALRSE
jgi:putative ABC transport system permease protein